MVDRSTVTGIPVYVNNNGNPPPNPYPAGNTANITANSQKVYRLNATTNKMGLGVTLKVMAGDKIDIFAKSYYFLNGSTLSNPVADLPLLDILMGFTGTGSVIASGKNATGSGLNTLNSGYMNIFKNSQPAQTTNQPKAFVNYLLFDENFKFVNGGFSRVGASGTIKDHFSELQNIQVAKSGYIYIYASNESQFNVYFDNLQVIHTRGSLLEETHYYPFGLTMAGISSKAFNKTSKNKEVTFQEQRFDDDLGLSYVQFKYRSHDVQIGRFIQLDPLSNDYRNNSTYAFSENMVVDGRELEGLEYVSIHHYADGTKGIKMHYKSSDKEINRIHGTTSGLINSASFGAGGRGVVHYHYNQQGTIKEHETLWEMRQTGGSADLAFHGLYSGPGSLTKDGKPFSTNYDFSFQPIDWADAIAKQHDVDYATATKEGGYVGYLEDVRTVQADRTMVARVTALIADIETGSLTSGQLRVEGVETPYRKSFSTEMKWTLYGQATLIDALATYKQWKIDNGYGNGDKYSDLRSSFRADHGATADIIDGVINSNNK